jgi:AraC-like DNA-binding protein
MTATSLHDLHDDLRAYPAQVLSDAHGYHQLLIGLHGGLDIEVAGRGARIEAGRVCLIPAGETHHYLALDPTNRCRVLDLPLSWVESLAPEAQRLFERPGTSLLPAVHWHTDPQQLLALLATRSGTGWPAQRLNLARLRRQVEARLVEPLRIAELAALCHLSERAFFRQLQALTGLSPQAWLARLRLQRAEALLRDGRWRLTDIAQACGYADSSHFAHAFHRHHGVSPRTWRQAQGTATGRS